MSEASGLRYRAVVESLWSLRGPVENERAPRERGVRYREGDARGIAPRLDVYVPTRRVTSRSVLLVHGGGFVFGSRDMKPMRLVGSRLSDAGVTVASIDYRLIGRGGRLDEALSDTRSALAFWRAGCAARDLDPDGVTIVGFSAGGTLSMLVAGEHDAGVRNVVSCFGLYELDHLTGPLATVMPRLLFRTKDRERWSARSPREAPPPRVPTLLLHGTADGLVPVAQAHRLADHRRKHELPTHLSIYEGAPHGFFNQPGAHAERGVKEILEHVLER
jgi:acetyl esterase/lipase